MDCVLECYRRAGFVVKASKLVRPTSRPITVLGFSIHGAEGSIVPATSTIVNLLSSTRSALCSSQVSGRSLGRLLGSWAWVLLLRRPAFSVLQHSYRYADVAGTRPFTLWPSVRRELENLSSLLPLLRADWRAPLFRRIVATDASEAAAGVVAAWRTDALAAAVWPLCSARTHGPVQAILHANTFSNPLRSLDQLLPAEAAAVSTLVAQFDSSYATVEESRWSVLISKRWSAEEHINALELRAVSLALHWLLSQRGAVGSRLLLLVDSLVAHGVLWKGRCSSASLLPVARKLAALQLAGGISLLPGWLPSECNPADEPSRRA
jgi:hypothetical protein